MDWLATDRYWNGRTVRAVLGVPRSERRLDIKMPPVCAICLDTRRCWTCEGQGSVERALDLRETCPRCAGTGVCTECQTKVSVGGGLAPQPLPVPLPRRS